MAFLLHLRLERHEFGEGIVGVYRLLRAFVRTLCSGMRACRPLALLPFRAVLRPRTGALVSPMRPTAGGGAIGITLRPSMIASSIGMCLFVGNGGLFAAWRSGGFGAAIVSASSVSLPSRLALALRAGT
ncbi:MAG: hypothetical protein JOY97_07730 [Hyphomicrobiales bacterium]|nr:hypothetical protein [Hyphomicrobiales bacterium]